MKNTWVVFCLYSDERLQKNAQKLNLLFDLFIAAGAKGVVLVDNHGNTSVEQLFATKLADSRYVFLRGSNQYAEFSAWLEGMDYVNARSQESEPNFILLNDTVYSHFKLFLWKVLNFNHFVSKHESCDYPLVMGERVNFPFRSEVFALEHDKFIRTALFFLNHQGYQQASKYWRLAFSTADSAFEKDCNSFELLQHFFSESSAYHVGRWLFAGGWYDAKPYHLFPRHLLRLKLVAIVCEHSISAACCNHNGKIVDSNLQNNFNLTEQVTLLSKMCLRHPLLCFNAWRKMR